MGRITASIDDKVAFIAEAEHRWDKANVVFISEDFPELCGVREECPLVGWIVLGQGIAERLNTRLNLKQDGFIGGVFCNMSEMKEGVVKRRKEDKKRRNQPRG